jgi:lipoprotein-anchoring transpeptidase ErfK/SrfK
MLSIRASCIVIAIAFISSATGALAQSWRSQSLTLEETYAPQRSYAPTRVLVTDPTGQKAGSVTIDTNRRALYLSLGGGQAIRYGVGVGRAGFEWRGRAHVGRKAEWPSWTPPAAMLKRRPDLPRFMTGGINNPLGARALYLYNGGRDTLLRIHGTNEPWTIGQAVSSGCIRMMNDDVMDLYSRVRVGASVRVI